MSWQGFFLSVWVLSTEAELPREEKEIIFLCANSSQLLVVGFVVYSPAPPTSKTCSACSTQFLTPHPTCSRFKEQDQQDSPMSNPSSVLRDERARGNLLHPAECVNSICIQNCDQTLGQRLSPGGRQLQGDPS